jgi:RHS repeat-associated protein
LGDGNPNKIFDDTNNLIAGLSPAIPSVDTPEDQVQLADLNGDGLIDIVYPTVAGLRVRLMERQSGGFGWGSERQIQLDTSTTPLTDPKCSDPNYFCSIYFTGAPSPKTSFMQLADFNGDASSDLLMGVIEDVMYVGGNCTPQFAKGMVAAQPGERSTPYHFGKPASRSANRMLAQASCPPDKMHKSVHAMTVRSITSTVITVGSYANVVGDPATIMLADANGDGLTDLFYRLTSSTDWAFRINNGSGMFAESTFGPIPNADEVQIVDVNGDGRADMLYPYGSVFYAMYAQPAGGWAAGVPLPGAFACVGVCDAWYVNLFGDFDGDGGIDHISIRPGDTPNIFVSRATPATGQFKPRDVITSITNGLGAQTTISYAALTNEDLYRRDSGSRDTYNWGRGAPVQDLIASSYAVASVSSSSPQAGNPAAMATVRYRYAGAKVQAGGRGFLGFREIVTIDTNESGGYVTTTTSYNQQFPFVGMPTQTIKRAAIGQSYAVPTCLSTPGVESCFGGSTVAFPTPAGNWFSDSTQIWEDDTEIAGTTTTAFVPGVQAPVHVRTAGTEEKLADPTNSAQTSRVLTTFGYGSYGNAISTTADTFTGVSATPTATVITSNVYTDTPTTWRLGRLTSTTVTHRRPNRADVVRTSTFAYATTTGLLNVEQVQPGGSTNQDLRKEYVLDVFGNRTTQETCAAPATSCSSTITFHPTGNTIQRYTRAAYDASGRYPLATYEPFWNGTGTVEKITQTVVARNLFGDVTQAYDLNGRDTLAVPGTFGRGYYNWAETVAGSIPGAPAGGVESTTTYRWCGTGTGQVSCPTGAKFRQKVATDGAPTQWTYFDVLGRPIMKAAESFNVAVSGKDVAATCTTYDATGKPKQVSNPFFLAGTAGADPSGLTSVCTTGRSWTTTSYDVLGRPVSVLAPDTSTVSNSYAGLTTTATDPRGNRTTQTRNGKGELTQVVDANGLAVTYWYLADGSMYLVQRDAGRGVIQNAFTYDALGRKIRQNDPDSGITDFEYNALGELTAQQSTEAGGKINRIENEIDARGRVWRRTVKQTVGTVTTVESISNYVFDTAANGIGQLASDSISGQYLVWKQTAQAGTDLNYSRSYSYDTLGRSLGSTTGIDGVNYTAAVQYDSLGRPWKMQDVSGRWAKTVFNSRGMTESVCNSSAADAVVTCPLTVDTYLRTLETDAWGHTIKERRGNNAAMDVSRDYVANTGRIFSICAGTVDIQGHCALMTEMYAWDAAGNLSSQSKEARYVESFAYDSLNRLRTGTLTMQDGITANLLVQSFEYDALGNLCRRMNSGWATREYTYIGRSGCGLGDGKNSAYGGGGTGTLGPHQASTLVAGTDSLFYYYDSRGNSTIQDGATGGSDRTISYSLDDKAYEASLPTGVRTRFWYGSDGARYKREDGSKRTLYLGNVEIVTEGAVTTVKRTIAGVMLQTVVGATATNYYLFHDQLGSLVRITNATGAIVNNMDFLALGGRRNFDTQGANGTAPTLTTRGFTGHEMVDGLNIVHMNGRIYDTYVGRFLQVDPVIQAPDNTQSWNAYSYCLNNPLTYTDPTGAMSQSVRQGLAIIIGIVAACFGQYYITHQMFAMAFAVAAAGGFVAGAIASQSLKGGLQGAFAAVVSKGIGVGVAQEYQLLAQAASGGIMESLQGGNFGHGFLVAGLTTAFMPQVGKIGNSVVRTAVGAIVGGTISDATGGKFANGALSGAIQAAMAGGTSDEQRFTAEPGNDTSFADAPPSLRALLENPETQTEGLRALAKYEGYGNIADVIKASETYYYNQYNRPDPSVNAIVVGGKMTVYPSAFTHGFYGLASIIDHEAVHVYQFRTYGPATTKRERGLREFAAYKYQSTRSNFWNAGYNFQIGQIGGWNYEIEQFRDNTGAWPIN